MNCAQIISHLILVLAYISGVSATITSTLSIQFLASSSSQNFSQLLHKDCSVAAVKFSVTETAARFVIANSTEAKTSVTNANFTNVALKLRHNHGLQAKPYVKLTASPVGYKTDGSYLCQNSDLGPVVGTRKSILSCKGWNLTYSISFTCDNGSDYYGWQCQHCVAVNTSNQCYTCSTDGSPNCCSSSYNTSNGCLLIPTTVPPPTSSTSTTLTSSSKIYRYTTYGLIGLAGLLLLVLCLLSCCLCRYYRKAEKESRNPYRDPSRYRQTSPNMVYSVGGDRMTAGGGAYYKPPSVTTTEEPETPPTPQRPVSNVRDTREQELLDKLYSQPIPRRDRVPVESSDSEGDDDYERMASAADTFDYQSAQSHPADSRGDPPPYPFRSSPSDHPVTYV